MKPMGGFAIARAGCTMPPRTQPRVMHCASSVQGAAASRLPPCIESAPNTTAASTLQMLHARFCQAKQPL